MIFIDTRAALEANSLKGNIYLVDNLKTDGSQGVGTENLLTVIKGSHWYDKTQVTDIVINWLVCPIGGLPFTLPKNYVIDRSESINKQAIETIKNFQSAKNSNEKIAKEGIADSINTKKLDSAIQNLATSDMLIMNRGEGEVEEIELGLKTFDVFGHLFDDNSDNDQLNSLAPVVADITGEAVDYGVLFTAQYGTPLLIKNGWYWSSSVDVSKTGIHNYTLHFTLYKRDGNTWKPIEMRHNAKIKVTSEAQRNGFTNAGMGYLPIY